ncbi:glycosyl hydrolase [Flavobacterium ranwuense]|uniref:Glycosyl hydrolase n=1 Tax=Flavobacterium ranwuense TaxID=2541725 RepID=A0ABY2DPF7_9FLAO|nr:glycoside hydrolase family 99-like domain-containing protein [Flavobacterium ranwuense]TDE28053.1 glycosyl hydrolase [Flavobacterium ranwuense]
MSNKIKPIAIYLPQFHPIPENDSWWGKGFTEWTNVTKAQPRFEGHYQPHLPADLGFYDLRLEEARLAQEAMAKEYGIYGFCYYHYWFNGKRILHEPLDRKLQNPKEDFPFMMCWANENWTRTWDGSDNAILLKQDYSESDDYEHIQFLCDIFKDKRYIRVDGKPFFVFYRVNLFPDIKKTLELFRKEAKRLGIGELYLACMESYGEAVDSSSMGMDATIEFPPHSRFGYDNIRKKPSLFSYLKCKLTGEIPIEYIHHVVDYREFAENFLSQSQPPYKCYPSITPMWDNTARKKDRGLILTDSTPEIYEWWLIETLKKYKPFSEEENFIFINAWNEWAEGNHLEPCRKWKHSYLEVTKRVLDRF